MEAVLRQRRRDVETFARWLTAEVDAELGETADRMARLRNRLQSGTAS